MLSDAVGFRMEAVWPLLAGGPATMGPVDLGFLGASPFLCESPGYVCWISLDFLGFSRQNLDFSMGYEESSRYFFRMGFSRRSEASERATRIQGHAEGPDSSRGKLSPFSDLLQSIVVGRSNPRAMYTNCPSFRTGYCEVAMQEPQGGPTASWIVPPGPKARGSS